MRAGPQGVGPALAQPTPVLPPSTRLLLLLLLQMAKGILHPSATWEHYRCWAHELPPLEGLSERCDGVLLSGGHYSAYEELEWIRELEAWLRAAVAQHPSVRFLGMCFGCQILATGVLLLPPLLLRSDPWPGLRGLCCLRDS